MYRVCQENVNEMFVLSSRKRSRGWCFVSGVDGGNDQ